MTIADQLREARTNLLTKLVEWSVCPTATTSYTIEGQSESISYGDYLKMLTEGIIAINDLLNTFDPYELRSVME